VCNLPTQTRQIVATAFMLTHIRRHDKSWRGMQVTEAKRIGADDR
jgi:hypothetical protein